LAGVVLTFLSVRISSDIQELKSDKSINLRILSLITLRKSKLISIIQFKISRKVFEEKTNLFKYRRLFLVNLHAFGNKAAGLRRFVASPTLIVYARMGRLNLKKSSEVPISCVRWQVTPRTRSFCLLRGNQTIALAGKPHFNLEIPYPEKELPDCRAETSVESLMMISGK
jgi:hypothetical protein